MISELREPFLFKPKNRNLKNASKIFFACHPDDFEVYFEDITNQILEKTIDNGISAVFSYANPDESISFEDIKAYLKNMQLVVIPVTWDLLQTPNTTITELVPYILEKHIPVLPLLQDIDLTDEYSKHFGNVQFLCDNKNDKTAIPYEVKLTDFLKNTLVGDELRLRVQAAFDAYIFLSYRKKDRQAAQEIMHLIHENEFCRDIAIWYDEFLTPGEDFNKSIKEAIEKSDLFAMVVTPNIVEPDNYIILHEYPAADTANKTILPLESIKTDKNKLSEYYKNIPDCTDVHNKQALSEELLRNLNIVAKQENADSPQHNYLIGLAYLTGIDVEVNYKRGTELIKKAAEADLPEAIARMATICRTGIGCKINYDGYDFWTQRLIDVYKKLYPKYDSDGWLHLMHSFFNRVLLHNATSNFLSAKSDIEQAIFYAKAVQKEKDIYYVCHVLTFSYISLAGVEQQLVASSVKESDNPLKVLQRSFKATLPALHEAEKILERYIKRHPEDNCETLRILTYTQLFSVYGELRELKKAKKYLDKLKEVFAAQNNKSLIDDLDFKWLTLEKNCKIDYTDEIQIKEQFCSLVEFLDKKGITKETALGIFQNCSQLCPLGDSLLEFAQLTEQDIEHFNRFVEISLAAYEAIPKKYETNFMLSSKSKILLLAATLEEHRGNKQKQYFYWQEYSRVLEVVLSRHNTIENKKALQKALRLLCWSALALKKYDEAFDYGGKNHKLCGEIAEELNNDESAYIDCVNHFNFTSHYFFCKENEEKCLEFAKVTCDMASSLRGMFNGSVNTSITLANVSKDYGRFLYDYGKYLEAIEQCKIADSVYHTVYNQNKQTLSIALKSEIIDALSDNLKLLADAYYEAEDFENAEKKYLYFLKINGDDEDKISDVNEALFNLSKIYVDSDVLEKAEEIISRLISNEPQNENYKQIHEAIKQKLSK